MTSERRFEQDLPDLLAQVAVGPQADYRNDIVRRTARIRQRPPSSMPSLQLRRSVSARAWAVLSYRYAMPVAASGLPRKRASNQGGTANPKDAGGPSRIGVGSRKLTRWPET